jgi:hypothetical protein
MSHIMPDPAVEYGVRVPYSDGFDLDLDLGDDFAPSTSLILEPTFFDQQQAVAALGFHSDGTLVQRVAGTSWTEVAR